MLSENKPLIKILIITPTLQCGGSEKYVSLLCNHIDTKKFAVTLAVVDNSNPFYTITNNAVTIVDLKVKHVRNALFRIKKVTNSINPDIIFTTANHLNIFIAIFKRLFFKKFIIIARESNVVSINNKHAKWPAFYNWLCKKFYAKLDFIICQSQYMQADLIKHYYIKEENTILIHNPVATGFVNNLPALQNKQLSINKFITVARLSNQKGIDRLLRAVAKLPFSFKYYIIGDGEIEGSIKNQIAALQLQDKVFLEGRKDNPFLGHEDATLFLMGSYYEGFPNSLLEAGIMGIPVIAFDAPGGINEIIIDGENGLLVKDNDETAFALAIEKALGMNFDRPKIKAGNEKRFAINEIIKRTEDLFIALFSRRYR